MIRLQNYYFSLVYLYKGRALGAADNITHLYKTTILLSSQSGAAALRSATLSRDHIPVLSRCNDFAWTIKSTIRMWSLKTAALAKGNDVRCASLADLPRIVVL